MPSQWPKPKVVTLPHLLLVFFVFSIPSYAGEVDVDMFGLTYHIQPKGAVRNAPLKLDKDGRTVFNPGLGLGYDFREDRQTEGLSPIVHGGVFENCDNHPFSFVGAGGRYRKYINKKTYWEFNVLAAATYGNSTDDKKYAINATPYANIGIGHDYGKYSITYYLSYIPQGSDGGITSSSAMIFLSTEVSF